MRLYKLGICYILGKECVVMIQDREDVPFDIRHRWFVEYKPAKLVSLRNPLGRYIQAVLTATDSGGEADA